MKITGEKGLKSKQHYTLTEKILYTLFGYPPRPMDLSEETWKKWNSRFQSPEYDWTIHSGTLAGTSAGTQAGTPDHARPDSKS